MMSVTCMFWDPAAGTLEWVPMRWVLAAALLVGCKGTPNKPVEPARTESAAAATTPAPTHSENESGLRPHQEHAVV